MMGCLTPEMPSYEMIVTSAAAAPFEVLRVKSMILLESAGWTEVLRGFVVSSGSDKALVLVST